MPQADLIRHHVLAHYAEPARRAGAQKFTVRAGDVHRSLGLSNAMPNVCSAIGGSRFRVIAGVELVSRSGPPAGANVVFTFAFRSSGFVDASGFGNGAENGTAEAHDGMAGVAGDRVARQVPSGAVRARPAGRPPRTAPGHSPADLDLGGALVLVACVKSKRPVAAPARDLYTSPLFQGARRFVETHHAPWFILSAHYGLVCPDTVIAPYELTLKTMPIAERRAWAHRILERLLPEAAGFERVVFFAGARYREFLEPRLRAAGHAVFTPLEHLAMGEQISWFSRRG